MTETPQERAASVEAVRFARREACKDVVADLEAEVAWLRSHLDNARRALYEIGYGTWRTDDRAKRMVGYAQAMHADLDKLNLTNEDARRAEARALPGEGG